MYCVEPLNTCDVMGMLGAGELAEKQSRACDWFTGEIVRAVSLAAIAVSSGLYVDRKTASAEGTETLLHLHVRRLVPGQHLPTA